jgi:hypothetical protein
VGAARKIRTCKHCGSYLDERPVTGTWRRIESVFICPKCDSPDPPKPKENYNLDLRF